MSDKSDDKVCRHKFVKIPKEGSETGECFGCEREVYKSGDKWLTTQEVMFQLKDKK